MNWRTHFWCCNTKIYTIIVLAEPSAVRRGTEFAYIQFQGSFMARKRPKSFDHKHPMLNQTPSLTNQFGSNRNERAKKNTDRTAGGSQRVGERLGRYWRWIPGSPSPPGRRSLRSPRWPSLRPSPSRFARIWCRKPKQGGGGGGRGSRSTEARRCFAAPNAALEQAQE